MPWRVTVHKKVAKGLARLPGAVQESLITLLREMEQHGPVRGNWPNYSRLGTERHHCHLKKGRPTYVAIWRVNDPSTRWVEVVYVGTHEKAPY